MKAYVSLGGFRYELPPHVAIVVLPVILGLVAAVMLVGAIAAGQDSRLLAAEGVAVMAEVREKHTEEHVRRSGKRRHRSTTYHVMLAFVAEDGRRVVVEEAVSQRIYGEVGTGGRVAIRYARSKPGLIEFTPGEKAADARFGWLAAGIMVLVALGAAVWAWVHRNDPEPEI